MIHYDTATETWTCDVCGWTFRARTPSIRAIAPRHGCPGPVDPAALTARLLAEIDAAIDAGEMAPWSHFPPRPRRRGRNSWPPIASPAPSFPPPAASASPGRANGGRFGGRRCWWGGVSGGGRGSRTVECGQLSHRFSGCNARHPQVRSLAVENSIDPHVSGSAISRSTARGALGRIRFSRPCDWRRAGADTHASR